MLLQGHIRLMPQSSQVSLGIPGITGGDAKAGGAQCSKATDHVGL